MAMRRWPDHFAVLLVASLAACVALPKSPENTAASLRKMAPVGFPAHIAVLPIINGTGSSDGPVIVRAFAARVLGRELGFIVAPTGETDEILAGRQLIWTGHPEGRELLSKQTSSVLAAWLGVEGLLYGELLSYSRQSISIFSESSVKVHFWLVDASGKKIWEDRKESSDAGVSLGSVSLDNILGDGSLSPDVQNLVRRSSVSETAYNTVDAAFADFPRRL